MNPVYRLPSVVALLILAIGTSMPTVTANESRPFSIHDMLAMQRIGDPQISPDGKQVVFVLRTTDMEANRGRTDLWMVGTDGKGLRQLTTHEASDVNPRWLPDGSAIMFLSSRSGSMQVWKLPLAGGEARQVTDLPLDVGNLVVGPKGRQIAYTLDVFPDLDSLQKTKDRLDDIEKQQFTGKVYDKLFFRHWDKWKDGRRSHLFVHDLRSDEGPVDIMKGIDADCPSKPFGGPDEIAFTPAGHGIVFSCRNEGREEAWSTNFDLYTAQTNGAGKPQRLTRSNKAWDTAPLFSPDGETLAYLAMSRPGYESDRFKIILRDWRSGSERVLAEEWDRSAGGLCWSPDGQTLYAIAANLGQRSLFSIDVATGEVATVVEKGTVVSVGAAGERLIFGLDTLKSPVELYSVNPDGSDVQPITEINKKHLEGVDMGDYEQFTFKGWNDELVHAYVVKPVNFEEGKKYPVAFLIHGGPQGSFGNHFHYRWNPQAYAGAGYAAVMVDFHGSTGYGQAFCDSIRGDWGGKPFEDLQKGLAATLKRYDWMDDDKVAALGASFGGFMINWIAGNWPDRFTCLVNHDGNLDERLAYFDTEELWFPEWDHEGTPWENPEGYAKHNPINHVDKWKTPMLVIHGALDYRVVDTQGMSTFTALQRRGVPSKFLYFPDENHWVLKPHNSIQWHETVLDWLDQWTK